jgi:hypothetical protein
VKPLNMVMSPAGLGTKNDCAGEDRQKFACCRRRGLSLTAANWAKETIRGMTHRQALERWGKKIIICDVTPQAILPIVKSLIKRDAPKAPTAIHCHSGLQYQSLEKADTIADSFENKFTRKP